MVDVGGRSDERGGRLGRDRDRRCEAVWSLWAWSTGSRARERRW